MSVDQLKTLARALNDDPAIFDLDFHAANGLQKRNAYGVPEQIIRQCEAVVASVLGCLLAHDTLVGSGDVGAPPRW